MRRKRPKKASRGIAWLLMVAGLAIVILAAVTLAEAWQSLSWPSVQGSISSHRVTKEAASKSSRYGVQVTYSYWVDGRIYWGDVYSHSSSTLPGTYSSQEEALSEYADNPRYLPWQTGRAVTVHYNPQELSDSVLLTGRTGLSWTVVALGAGLLGGGLYELARFRRQVLASGNVSSAPPG